MAESVGIGGVFMAESVGDIGPGVGSLALQEDEGEECAGLEPFFFDEAVAVAEHAAAEEKRRKKEEEEAREREHIRQRMDAYMAALDKIVEYDPKMGGKYATRFYMVDLSVFDLDEESPLGPMRYTEKHTEKSTCANGTICRQGGNWFFPSNSANVLSVKIISSDVGFPINVYGTVVARDSLDWKCIYLFNRDRDSCQLINSADDQLILTGPKRGLVLIDAIYFEMDLKIKDDQGQDKELSKGLLKLDGIQHRFLEEMVVESDSLGTRLSMVEVTYAVVQHAVEATIAVEVVQGQFDGTVTACTTNIQQSLVLYDSKVAGAMTAGDSKNRSIQLMRSVVAVCMDEMLEVTIAQGETEKKIHFTPDASGGESAEFPCGPRTMRVKVAWSIMSRYY